LGYAVSGLFLNSEQTHNTASRSSIVEPEVVKHDVKQMILNQVKFYAHVD